MNRTLSLIAGAAFVIASSTPCIAQDSGTTADPDLKRAQSAMSDLGDRLRSALQATIARDGVVAAVGFCAAQAPTIAAEVSAEHHVAVGRSGVRQRNPGNAPKPWQQEALAQFASQAKAGADPATLSYQSRVAGQLRLAKGLRVDPPCLLCHGDKDSIAPEVTTAIAQQYPEDRATGFAVGELRGLVWAEVTDSEPPADARHAVSMTGSQQSALRAQMRIHLEAVQQLIGAIAEKDWSRVAEVARSQGPGSGRGAGAHSFRSALPEGWFAFARPMHRAMSEIADEAENHQRVDIALGKLAEATGQCTACHVTFRIQTSDQAVVPQLTALQ
jgi:hypothetical protein